MKKIKIKFIGICDRFNVNDNRFTNTLRKRYEVEITDDADYAFVFPFSKGFPACNFRGIRIFYSGENICPDFNIFDYGISFNYLEYGDRYYRLPNSNFIAKINDEVNRKHLNIDSTIFDQKDIFCAFMYSHEGILERTQLFNKISNYKPIVSPGKYLNNCSIEIPQEKNRANQIQFEGRAKFVIACENSSFPGYVTEKLTCAFAAKSIPIYFGDPMVDSIYNSNAFINCHNYSDLDSVLERIVELDQDDDKYLEMLRQPAFIDPLYLENEEKRFEEFLYNIFDQDYEDAFRRPSNDWSNKVNSMYDEIEMLREKVRDLSAENSIYSRHVCFRIKRKLGY